MKKPENPHINSCMACPLYDYDFDGGCCPDLTLEKCVAAEMWQQGCDAMYVIAKKQHLKKLKAQFKELEAQIYNLNRLNARK